MNVSLIFVLSGNFLFRNWTIKCLYTFQIENKTYITNKLFVHDIFLDHVRPNHA